MRRRLFNLVAGLSLLAWVAVVGLWVQSYLAPGIYGGKYGLGSMCGRFIVLSPYLMDDFGLGWDAKIAEVMGIPPSLAVPPPPRFVRFDLWVARIGVRAAESNCRMVLGFGLPLGTNPLARSCIIPYWLPALLFAALPAWWMMRRPRRVRAGHCGNCGYDLRASKDRCPECGTPITAKVEAKA